MWQRVTNPDHEPRNAAKFNGTTPDALVFRASQIGGNLVSWVKSTLESSAIRSDMFRTVDSVLRFAAAADKQDIESAALKASKLKVFSVKGFKNLYNSIHTDKDKDTRKDDDSLSPFSFSPIYLGKDTGKEVR